MGEFGREQAVLFPPPADQLLETSRCHVCEWEGSGWVWPLVASLGSGVGRIETPIGHRRAACPVCGTSLDPRSRHPSAG